MFMNHDMVVYENPLFSCLLIRSARNINFHNFSINIENKECHTNRHYTTINLKICLAIFLPALLENENIKN